MLFFEIHVVMKSNYDMLINKREQVLGRIQELEADLGELHKQLDDLDAEIETAKVPAVSLTVEEKVELFRTLFRGREDVFARRWFSKKSGKSGYQPVCMNEWRTHLCDKKSYHCSECPNRQFSSLSYHDYYRHLEGKDPFCEDVIGCYVIKENNTCHFLCADFDDKNCVHGYQSDVLAFVAVCHDWGVPCHIERSRSGNGAHMWVFFEQAIPAVKARKLGNAILTEAMNRDGRISLKSYDRLFPNQDFLPEGGLGNLVALPLQGKARREGNSVFVNEKFEPYPDQWGYLLYAHKITEDKIDYILNKTLGMQSLGALSKTSERKPWEMPVAQQITSMDFADEIVITRSNMLYIPSTQLPAKVLNHLKRMASFKNPEFYQRQAMRLSTHNTPRIICCADITEEYLALPRGCEDSICDFFNEKDARFKIIDETNAGTSINANFNGKLRKDQVEAVALLSQHSNGVLSATTAFGKTVTAIGLIAQLKVNTLILVHTKALLDQWREKFDEFLAINHEQNEQPSGRGRRKKWSPVGALSSQSNSLHGIIDIALIQSCISNNEVKPFLRNYGMVIVDECHHVSAFSFEQVLKATNAARVYGLTATPIRKDGHQPIIFMQCGPIRYTADSEHQMQNQTFERILVPRFTSFRLTSDENPSYNKIVQALSVDEYRNNLIVKDVCDVVKQGRSPIILTNLTSHVETLAQLLRPDCKNVITLVGSESTKEKRLKQEQLQAIAHSEPLVIVATGKYVGEGFDFPRLDTLFLALPVSWKGIVAQYAGRLHRDFDGKDEVRIYDYIDIHMPMCETMYNRRLKGYSNVGYRLKATDGLFAETAESSIIYNGQSFVSSFVADMAKVKRSIIIACPKTRWRQQALIPRRLADLALQGINILVYTREKNEHTAHLQQHGIDVIESPNLIINCAIIDHARVWYGDVRILGYHSGENNIITFHNPEVATTLIEQLSNHKLK